MVDRYLGCTPDYCRVEAEGYGNGGRTWCNDNIAAFVNVKPVLAARGPDAFVDCWEYARDTKSSDSSPFRGDERHRTIKCLRSLRAGKVLLEERESYHPKVISRNCQHAT